MPVAPPEPLEPPLPIYPELIRVIRADQFDDSAGLQAMQALIASESARHFLVPLPPGLTELSPELLGFFVYELRVGRADDWSTAQAHFGPALRVTGRQTRATADVRSQPAPQPASQRSRSLRLR